VLAETEKVSSFHTGIKIIKREREVTLLGVLLAQQAFLKSLWGPGTE
jgi:hypothetical protein